jgi:hypothetical protein
LDFVDKIIAQGLQGLKKFHKITKTKELEKYYQILEEWEDLGDKMSGGTIENFLNPSECLDMELKFHLEK